MKKILLIVLAVLMGTAANAVPLDNGLYIQAAFNEVTNAIVVGDMLRYGKTQDEALTQDQLESILTAYCDGQKNALRAFDYVFLGEDDERAHLVRAAKNALAEMGCDPSKTAQEYKSLDDYRAKVSALIVAYSNLKEYLAAD